jgi:hypothetical protein
MFSKLICFATLTAMVLAAGKAKPTPAPTTAATTPAPVTTTTTTVSRTAKEEAAGKANCQVCVATQSFPMMYCPDGTCVSTNATCNTTGPVWT